MADLYGRGAEVDRKPRCWRCGRLLAEAVSRPWLIRCTRCKASNGSPDAFEALVDTPEGSGSST